MAKQSARWIAVRYEGLSAERWFTTFVIKCSKCGRERKNAYPNPEFCPNCFRKMTNAREVPVDWEYVLE